MGVRIAPFIQLTKSKSKMETETLPDFNGNIPKPKRTRTPKPNPPANPETFNWGKREFGIIAKSFEAEPQEVQNTMIAISGMLQIIKLNLSEQPLVISYLVRKAYPQLSEAAILGNLQLGRNITEPGCVMSDTETLPDHLTDVASRTSTLDDAQWNAFWDGMFKAIASPLTQWPKVCVYAPYVYNVLVKPIVK